MIYDVIYSLLVLIEKIGVFQQTVLRVYYILIKSNMYLKKLSKKSISWLIWDRLIDCHSNAQAPRFEKQVKTLILTGF